MKSLFTLNVFSCTYIRRCAIRLIAPALLFFCFNAGATTRTSIATGNWSNPNTWSPAGIPGSTDSIVIHGGDTVTVDASFTCNNLDLGDAKTGNATLNITSA